MRKRNKKEKRFIKTKIIINIILFTFLIFFIVNTTFGIYKEQQIKEKKEISNIITNKNQENENIIIEDIKPKENIAEEYLEYKVDAKLEVPKINLETYVLKTYTKQALDTCATKFWGPNPNEIGNYCIAGHNVKKENMFYRLNELQIGDKIYLSDNKNGKWEYIIYDIYKVLPEDTSSLKQDTNNKREITLITCTNYSNHRIIIKAKEV